MAHAKWWGLTLALALGVVPAARADDTEVSENLIRRSQCSPCHALEKNRMYPSWKTIAARYKDKDKVVAENKLYKFLTDRSRIEFNRIFIQHDPIRSTDEAEIRTTIRWILAR